MLLTIETTQRPATDLGYLLHKHPDRFQSFELPFGKAHVFYPRAEEDRCAATLLLDIDPIALVRRRRGPAGEGFALEQYVNDRPYVASSFLSVAIARVYGSALSGRCPQREQLAETALPLTATIEPLPCRGGEQLLHDLFGPLGYEVLAQRHPLDDQFQEWGQSPYYTVTVAGNQRLQDLLAHLYVLIPVHDNDKHYWVGEDEVEKLLLRGESWLRHHPRKDLIAARYLKYQGHLTRAALARLADEDDPDPDLAEAERDHEEAAVDERLNLHEQRIAAVLAALRASGARRVLDLGCGEGRLLAALLRERQFEEIAGLDVSVRALEIAAQRLKLDRLPDRQRSRIKLVQGSLTYRDPRLAGYDAAAIVEVIEHFDAPRVRAFERVVFEFARPRTVIITTPNVEYNVKWEALPAGRLRHRDHRFEWTRLEFQEWSVCIARRYGYAACLLPIGPEDDRVGAPTQMCVFSLPNDQPSQRSHGPGDASHPA